MLYDEVQRNWYLLIFEHSSFSFVQNSKTNLIFIQTKNDFLFSAHRVMFVQFWVWLILCIYRCIYRRLFHFFTIFVCFIFCYIFHVLTIFFRWLKNTRCNGAFCQRFFRISFWSESVRGCLKKLHAISIVCYSKFDTQSYEVIPNFRQNTFKVVPKLPWKKIEVFPKLP